MFDNDLLFVLSYENTMEEEGSTQLPANSSRLVSSLISSSNQNGSTTPQQSAELLPQSSLKDTY